MNRSIAYLLLFVITVTQTYAETVIGRISKAADGNLYLNVAYTQQAYKLKMQGDSPNYLASFVGYDTYLKISGEKQQGAFVVDRTPVIVSAPSKLNGRLTISGNNVYIDQHKVAFAKISKVNGYSFNENSIKYFANKQVITNGKFENGLFTITAIVPANILSTHLTRNQYNSGIHSDFSKDPMNYVLNDLPQNTHSQTIESFRGILIGEGQTVRPSQYALVITSSGRQGEDLGAANGHFALGIAKVNNDLSLDMEVHNYYPVKNEKMIIPGYIDYVDYFGGLTSGQNNYRPTYTIVIYGEDRDRLLKMRSALDKEYADLRNGAENFSIGHNCTTVSVNGLLSIGITGKMDPSFRDNISLPPGLDLNTIPGQLRYILGKNPALYLPRVAFESYLKNLRSLIRSEKVQGFRIDYIFQAQTPSDRPVGGIAVNGFVEGMKIKLKEQEHAKRPFRPDQIWAILNEIN